MNQNLFKLLKEAFLRNVKKISPKKLDLPKFKTINILKNFIIKITDFVKS